MIGLKPCLSYSTKTVTELAQAIYVMNGASKDNLHFDDQVNKMIFCFALWYF